MTHGNTKKQTTNKNNNQKQKNQPPKNTNHTDTKPPNKQKQPKPTKKSLLPIRRDGSVYYFQTQNAVHKDLIEKKYLEQLTSALSAAVQLLGHDEEDISIVLLESDQIEITPQPPEEPVHENSDSSLNPTYTFETFVVGSSNEFAHAAARAVADQPGTVI